jgi:hypothetical protein
MISTRWLPLRLSRGHTVNRISIVAAHGHDVHLHGEDRTVGPQHVGFVADLPDAIGLGDATPDVLVSCGGVEAQDRRTGDLLDRAPQHPRQRRIARQDAVRAWEAHGDAVVAVHKGIRPLLQFALGLLTPCVLLQLVQRMADRQCRFLHQCDFLLAEYARLIGVGSEHAPDPALPDDRKHGRGSDARPP